MIRKSALIDLTRPQALFRFNEAKRLPGAVVEMIEQDNGRWTVTIVWDDGGEPLSHADTSAFDRAEAPPAGAAAALGSLSARFESNGRAGAIGHDSTGGFSYGAYQIASKVGSMGRFLDFLTTAAPDAAATLQAAGGEAAARSGDAAFRAAWQALAADPTFLALQHGFIQATHYEPFARRLVDDLGLDLAQRSAALRDVAWSVAVQHGPGNAVFHRALSGQDLAALDDRAIIERVYAERGQVEVYFASSTAAVKSAVANRFEAELGEALSRLA